MNLVVVNFMNPNQLLSANENARRAFDRGDYATVISCADEAKNFIVSPGLVGTYARTLLNEKARALRNLGRIPEALEVYTDNLRGAKLAEDELDLAWQLVLFGKLFGKYLDRQSLFSACLKEAQIRLDGLIEGQTGTALEHQYRLYLRCAIVHDLLGSYFRRIARMDSRNRELCERAHTEALNYHKRIGNLDGVARARCHLGYAAAVFAMDNPNLGEEERIKGLRAALLKFEAGAVTVYRNAEALSGWATRRIQHGEIFLFMGKVEVALKFVEEGLKAAAKKNDSRAVILGAQVKARCLWALGRASETPAPLEYARHVAHEWQYIGFERTLASQLGEAYLNIGEDQRAIECFEQADQLIEKELREFNAGLDGALDAFRAAVPGRAEQYLLEGQQSDYGLLVENLRSNARILRDLIARRERTKSVHLQLAIDRFARAYLRHAIRNDLQEVKMLVRRLRQRVPQNPTLFQEFGEETASAEEAIGRISLVLKRPREGDDAAPSSLVQALLTVSRDYFPPDRIQNLVSKDAAFPGLAPLILQEALRHLLENAAAAVQNAPPDDEKTPLLQIRNELDAEGYDVFLLMNPGTNPTTDLNVPHDGTVLHGFGNARLFFEGVLDVHCTFGLRSDGPRTLPHLTNSVILRLVGDTRYRPLWVLRQWI